MSQKIDIQKFKNTSNLKDRYTKQIQRLQAKGIAPGCIEEAVSGVMGNLDSADNTSLVVYGEPQSGKTEMMICLTAQLLDSGFPIIVHLMNDSVDLLTQNLKRFKRSGLAPAARSLSELLQLPKDNLPKEIVVFCKKNAKDLDKLIAHLGDTGSIVVIDDEADYATPNAKVNEGSRTKINDLVATLVGTGGYYIGVTATPARLDLNNTLGNDTEKWVYFPSHAQYTGQDVFFPIDGEVSYRLVLFQQGTASTQARDALLRFFVTAAYLNSYENGHGRKLHDARSYEWEKG